jgi:hypothetical protein
MEATVVLKQFKIEVTYNGLTETMHVKSDDLLGAVRDRAVKIFKVTQQPHLLSLHRESGQELDPSYDNQTVDQVGITPCELLVLRPGVVRGGGHRDFSTTTDNRPNNPSLS